MPRFPRPSLSRHVPRLRLWAAIPASPRCPPGLPFLRRRAWAAANPLLPARKARALGVLTCDY